MRKEVSNTLDILHNYMCTDATDRTEDTLDHWAAMVIASEDYGFEKGLLGLGWLIAYLIHEKYIEGDADEILEDIDDNLYKLTLKEVLDSETRVLPLLHYVTYYQQRLQYESKTSFYRRFAHFECMKLLLEKLNRFLLEPNNSSPEIITAHINVLLKYSYLMKTCISENLVEEAFYPAIERLLSFFESQKTLKNFEEDIAKLHICVKQYANPYWIARIDHLHIAEKTKKNTINHSEETSPFWRNLNSCFRQQEPSFDNKVPCNKQDLYNMYLYCTNIKTTP